MEEEECLEKMTAEELTRYREKLLDKLEKQQQGSKLELLKELKKVEKILFPIWLRESESMTDKEFCEKFVRFYNNAKKQ